MMKAVTRIRAITRLMRHVEDLPGLKKLHVDEVPLIQDGLLLLIEQIQCDAARKLGSTPSAVPCLPSSSRRTYQFPKKRPAHNRILVYEQGQPVRQLHHIPIFAYGFGFSGLPALDTALAILADAFGEKLSMQAFSAGNRPYCYVYKTFARTVVHHLSPEGQVETKQIKAFLRRAERERQAARENSV